MKKVTVCVSVILAIIWGSSPGIFAGELDTYYLERFGELPGGSSALSGVSRVTDNLPLDRCGTPTLHSLRHDWKTLAVGTQQVLAKYLAKPVLAGEAQVRSADGYFTIHYATSGSDAPPLTDGNRNGIPDWVETVAAVFDAVYTREVVDMGYRPAPLSGGQPYDIYLQNSVEGVGYLGVTKSVSFISSISATSFIVIDNDFMEFGTRYTPLEYLKITAAHEYHHAIQYGYNYYFDVWYAEATSTWIEDEVFDSVDQLYDYLPQYLQNPRQPLDTPVSVYTGGGYGRWIFNRYLAEIKGREFIKSTWDVLATLPAPADGRDIKMTPVLNGLLDGKLDQYVLGLGRRFVQRDWASHQAEIALIHPVVTESSTGTVSYPVEPYSFALYPAAVQVSLSSKPAGIAALYLSNVLLLCNNLTGSTVVPADPFPPIPSLQDAMLSDKAPSLVTGPTITSNIQGSGGGGGGGCFIATAAYGSYLHPKVLKLREFRDRWLMTNAFGRMLVQCYYRVSPPVAELIASHEWMRTVCRALLIPLVTTLEYPGRVSLLLSGLFGWIMIRRRFAV